MTSARLGFSLLATTLSTQVGAAELDATYSYEGRVPLTTAYYTATGNTVNFTLNFAPEPGTTLTVVKTLARPFIQGEFDNLANGAAVDLMYGGDTYHFVAWYYGGDGNDLVLIPRDTTLAAWGWNLSGSLGDNSTAVRDAPVLVDQSGVLVGKTIVALEAGTRHSLALCSDGSLAAWGSNSYGQLGNNSTASSNVPVLVDQSGVLAGKAIVALSAGLDCSLALCSDGTLAAWGHNDEGQLGDGTTIDRNVPVLVDQNGLLAGKTLVSIAAGASHNLALCSDGTLAAWGYNGSGMLGNPNITDRYSPIPVLVDRSGVLSGRFVKAIAAGLTFNLALCSDGKIAAWGSNIFGQLGNNSNVSSNVPILVNQSGVLAGKTPVAITAGHSSSLALCFDGTLAAWGNNRYGELGDNSTTDRNVPVLVDRSGVIAGKTPVAIAAGASSFHALCSDGTATGWGYNNYGQLGDNSKTDRHAPVLVDHSAVFSSNDIFAISMGEYHGFALFEAAADIAVEHPVNTDLSDDSATIDFGSTVLVGSPVLVGSSVQKTFTIRNRGALSLTDLAITFDGPDASHFSITANPATAVAPGGSTTFTVRFSPSSIGAKTAELHIASNDRSENPFDITLTGTGGVPEISVEHPVSTDLTDGSSSIDFGTTVLVGSEVEKTFTIRNTGTYPLTNVAVTLDGTDMTDFSVTNSPSAWVSPGSSTSFAVRFVPGSPGAKTAALHIASNDADENPFDIALNGTGVVTTLPASYSTGSETPLTTNGINGTGSSVNFTLNYAPTPGTRLTVVNNTGTGFIQGEFDNLPNGAAVDLSYGGETYSFVAWYYGGDGNDLVLVPRHSGLAAWGENYNGQLGDNSTTDKTAPILVDHSGVLSGRTIVSAAAGTRHVLALCSDGTMAAWGHNSYGQLGDNSTTNRNVPVLVDQSGVLSGKTVVSIAVGTDYSLALCSDGTLASWGANDYGQLGDNSTTRSKVPVLVDQSGVLASKTVVSVTAGSDHNLVLCSDGTLASWGYNTYGQLGDNSTTHRNVPVLVDQSGVLASKTVDSVTAGADHNLVLCSDGTLAAWGWNREGQLGNGTLIPRPVPVLVDQSGVLSGKTVVSIAAGTAYSLALCSDGTLASWGANDYGQLGFSSSPFREWAPVLVDRTGILAGKTVVSVAASRYHNLALCSDGTLAAWGYNGSGQLGDNTTTDRYTPVLVDQSGVLASHSVFHLPNLGSSLHTLALFEKTSEITVEHPLNNNLTDGSANIEFIDFGPAVEKTFTVRNTGNAPLTNLAITFDGAGAADFSITESPDSQVEPGDSTTFTVQFLRSTPGPRTAMLHLASNDVDENPFDIALTATAGYPEISVEHPVGNDLTDGSAAIDFGEAVMVGIELEKTFTIRNSGNAPLTNLAITLDGTDAGDFSVAASPATEVAPGGSTHFTVRFAPGSAGAKTAVLHLANNDADEAPFDIALTGSSTGATSLLASYASETEVPLTTTGFTATGNTVHFALNYAPRPGAQLTVLDITSREMIQGNFDNLANGEIVDLTFADDTYRFVAWYYGGDGNDLVLIPRYSGIAAWGWNFYGQLGDNSNTNRTVPVYVAQNGVLLGKTIVSVAAGSSHNLVLCSDGTLASWGNNTYGQLGDNSTTQRNVPVSVDQTGVLAGKSIVAIAAGNYHSMALCADGTLTTWGWNSNGQLGDNSTNSSSVPVDVTQSGGLSGKTVVSVAAGARHSLALCSDGSLAAWGSNQFGQLGDNSTLQRNVPVLVDQTGVLAAKNTVAITAGDNHSLVLCSDGSFASWGSNRFGQLGDNSTTDRRVPVPADQSGVLAGKTVVSLTKGGHHNLALCSDGTLVAWGRNNYGQLGVGSTNNSSVPVLVDKTGVLAGKTVISAFAGDSHSLVLCSDGTFAAWGWNTYGQLGDNSTTRRTVPVLADQSGVLSGSNVISASGGDNHSIAFVPGTSEIDVENPVNTSLSDGSTMIEFDTIVLVGSGVEKSFTVRNTGGAPLTDLAITIDGANASDFSVTSNPATEVAPGGSTTFTVRFAPGEVGLRNAELHIASNDADENPFDISLAGWGGPPEISVEQPVGNDLTDGSAAIDFGTSVLVGSAVEKTFTVRNTGDGLLTGIGIALGGTDSGDFSVTASPATTVYPGESTSFTVRFVPGSAGAKTAVLHIANNDADENPFDINLTGTGTSISLPASYLTGSETPLTTEGFDGTGSTVNFTLNYAPTLGTTLAVVNNTGSDFIQGEFDNLANGDNVNLTFGAVTHAFVAWYYGGDGNDLVLVPRQTGLAAWGRNSFGQLGDNSFDDHRLPTSVDQSGVLAGKTIVSIAAGYNHSLALCSDGTLTAWGWNVYGQLGDNSEATPTVPIEVTRSGVLNGKTVISVAAGVYHSVALCSDGTLAAWGRNNYGQLGDGSTTASSVPVLVDQSGVLAGKTVISLSAGAHHSVVLCSDGTLAAWGWNANGQLGDGSTTDSSIPALVNQNGVLAGKTVISLSAGELHSIVLCSDGTLAAWGRNYNGQLGDGSTTDSSGPVLVDETGVLADKDIVAITAGYYHSLALCSDGTLASWGYNASGQLGDNSTLQRNVPVLVNQGGALAGKTVVSAAASRDHTLALCSDGVLTAWGRNNFGQLGDNTTVQRTAPVLVDQSGLLTGNSVISASCGHIHTVALFVTKPEIVVEQPVNTSLTDDSTTIEFSTIVLVGSGVEKSFTVRNTGGAPLTDLAIIFDGANASDFSVTANPATDVAPGSSTTFTVRFAPSEVGLRNAELHIASNDADENPFDISLIGWGGPPEISVEQPVGNDLTDGSAAIDFGTTLLVGSTVDKTFTVRNTGTAPLTGLAISIEGSDATSFNILSSPATILAPGGSTNFTVRFVSSSVGTKTASLRLANNDEDENPFDIAFTGSRSLTLDATYTTGNEVPLALEGFSAAGFSVNPVLNYAPTPGTNLTVVNNTGQNPIEGEFDNLPHGSNVTLDYLGTPYEFIAWYTGGEDGNDLVLLWRDGSLVSLWSTDSDSDGVPWGIEHALGTNADLSDLDDPAHYKGPILSPGGAVTVTFGRNPNAEAHTIWLLLRSTDLSPDSFQEIYRFDGTTQAETKLPGITSVLSSDSFTITDTNPPPGGAFYQFVPIYAP